MEVQEVTLVHIHKKKYDHVKGNTMSTMNNQKDNRPAYETDTNPNHHYIVDIEVLEELSYLRCMIL